MARKRITNRQQLMQAAETILLERGYDGFHFKGLSEKLQIARSTIYEYYSNKDELIADYMKSLMEEIIEECNYLDNIPGPLEKLKELLVIFLNYSYIHQILQIRPLIEANSTESIASNIKILDDYHRKLFTQITTIIDDGKKARFIRQDIPTTVIASILFNAIEIPNRTGLSQNEWANLLFKIFLEGMRQCE